MPTNKTAQAPAPIANDIFRERVIVKFHDDAFEQVKPLTLQALTGKSLMSHFERLALPALRALQRADDQAAFLPLFPSIKPEALSRVIARAERFNPKYRAPNFFTYFALSLPLGSDALAVAKAFSAVKSVQFAYVEPFPSAPPTNDPLGDELYSKQRYLFKMKDGKAGINAAAVWHLDGSGGEGQALVDLEQGWDFSHADLPSPIHLISGSNRTSFTHGTNVLGVIAAQDTPVGSSPGYCIGIAPKAAVSVISQWRTEAAGEIYTTAAPILEALSLTNMQPGNVLLLEAQATLKEFSGYENVPVEVEPSVFQAIELATNAGIVVVEAAGNGAANLDTLTSPFPDWFQGKRIYSPASADFKDSGAILVGAAWPASRRRRALSGYGKRVNCYAWGAGVTTLDTSRVGEYTDLFDGTSSASSIIAGAALVVQGLFQKRTGRRLPPQDLRAILQDSANGTASESLADLIGVMPDLGKIAEAINAGKYDSSGILLT